MQDFKIGDYVQDIHYNINLARIKGFSGSFLKLTVLMHQGKRFVTGFESHKEHCKIINWE